MGKKFIEKFSFSSFLNFKKQLEMIQNFVELEEDGIQ